MLKKFLEDLYDYYFERRHVVIKCQICGQKLAPFISHYGPKNCGWVRVSGRYGGFICHQCYGHGMCMTHKGLDELTQMVEERNADIDKKVEAYKWNHPWVKVRQI